MTCLNYLFPRSMSDVYIWKHCQHLMCDCFCIKKQYTSIVWFPYYKKKMPTHDTAVSPNVQITVEYAVHACVDAQKWF